MTALATDRNTVSRESRNFEFPLKAAALAYAGALACMDATGKAVPGSATTGLAALGIALERADNSAGEDGDINVKVRNGTWRLANSGVNPLTLAHVGSACYIEDDQTVGSSPIGKSVAGVVEDVDDAGVWVNIGVLPYPSAHDAYIQETTISAAQLLALYATPREIIPAPGAGKAIELVSLELFLDYASAAYNGIAAGEDLAAKYTDGAGATITTIETTGFLDATADAVRLAYAASAAAVAPVANAPVVLALLTGEIATGDSPLKVRARYRIIDTAW